MDYDTWLMRQAEYYCTPCEPKVIGIHQEPSDGEVMTSPIYNCEECDNEECEYWKEYN